MAAHALLGPEDCRPARRIPRSLRRGPDFRADGGQDERDPEPERIRAPVDHWVALAV
jgi:hypothetical protein